MAVTLPEAFTRAVRDDGARPFVTYYDDTSGERVELSYSTTANWVAKTANLLTDELDLHSGESVAIKLPTHWLGVVWALSSWSCRATLTAGTGEVAVVGPDTLQLRGRRATVATALRPLGGPFADPLPDGVLDYGAEVFNHGDLYVPHDPPRPDSPAYDGRTHAELIAAAEPISGRVLSTAILTDADGLGTLVGLILGGGSVVLCRHLDPATLDRRVTDELVDTVIEA